MNQKVPFDFENKIVLNYFTRKRQNQKLFYDQGLEENYPRVSHFDIPSDNPEGAEKFYKQVFDWKFEK